MTSSQRATEMNLRVSRSDGVLTISHPSEDKHVDVALDQEIASLSQGDLDARVFAPARLALGLQ